MSQRLGTSVSMAYCPEKNVESGDPIGQKDLDTVVICLSDWVLPLWDVRVHEM